MSEFNPSREDEPVLFQGRIFKVVERKQIGRSGKTLTRQVVVHPGAVGIVPILPDGRVALIDQFRITFERNIFEIPAGTREPGEDPMETAKRELIEETGFRADKMELLVPIYTSPGILQEELVLYLATGLTEGESALEDGERITLAPKTWQEIDKMIDGGEIVDAKSIAGLLLAKRRLGL